ncbi:unnamed protein product [Sphagnum jensenii]|uniref:Uncharacterized protein n=1 Tax=Sphagnum jensenii TaxID=128206 RepID=A0ABP0WK87_9BRYO
MATLRSKPLVTQYAVGRRHGATSDLRDRKKVVRVVCGQQNSVVPSSSRTPDVAGEMNKSSHEAAVVSMLQTGSNKVQSQWWSPLFDLPAEEDWSNVLHEEENNIKQATTVDAEANKTLLQELAVGLLSGQEEERPRSNNNVQRFHKQEVQFTDEKARILRKQLRSTETWHDTWYHSGIASRLAEPDQ